MSHSKNAPSRQAEPRRRPPSTPARHAAPEPRARPVSPDTCAISLKAQSHADRAEHLRKVSREVEWKTDAADVD
jgi:hypothetical protein